MVGSWGAGQQDYDCGSEIGYLEAVLAFAKTHKEIGEDARKLMKQMVG